MFISILDTNNLTILSALICIAVAILLGFCLALVHQISGRYSKNFMITLVMLPMIVQVVIVMVNGNLGTSVAILGAFSLIRFRSAPGNSRELLSVFLAMAIGLATGMGHIYFAIVFTIIACLMIVILTKLQFGQKRNIMKNLKIVVPEDLDYEEVFNDIFDEYTKQIELIKSKTINMGSLYELDYQVILKERQKEKNFIDQLRVKNGNLKIVLSHTLEDNEL